MLKVGSQAYLSRAVGSLGSGRLQIEIKNIARAQLFSFWVEFKRAFSEPLASGLAHLQQ